MQDRIGEADRIFSVGYEGRSIEEFVDLLGTAGIGQVADVRDNPWSRKPGFTGSELRSHLADASIGYVHLGDLGAPRAIRDGADDFLAAYRSHLDGQSDALEELVEAARDRPTAMMCLEADPADCHRQVIADRLRERGWTVIDVG